MTSQKMTLAEIHRAVSAALQASNTSVGNAESVATALVAAEAAGHVGHGLHRLADYRAQAANGKVDGYALPSIAQSAPGALIVDAGHGFAYPALDVGLDELPAIAASQGIAMLGIRRSHHCGALGCSVERLADAGFIAMMMSNSPAAMAPWGGSRRLLGNNPMAFAVPLADGPPVVVDLSLSTVARGRVLAAKQQGEAIPEGWALDQAGNPTTDAGEALAGTMLPLGGPKGGALALIVEFLAAGLTGANFASEASSFTDPDGHPPGVGQLMIAISPSAFGGDAVLGRFAELAAMVAGDGDAYLPGRRRQASREAAMRDGIDVDAEVFDQIATISLRD